MDWQEVRMQNPLNRTLEENRRINNLLYRGWEFWGGAHEVKGGYCQLFKRTRPSEKYLGRYPRDPYTSKKNP